MIPEDTLALLERVLQEGVGVVSCEYVSPLRGRSQTPGLCWACNLDIYRGGDNPLAATGTGSTLIEAVDEALTDLAESS